MHTFSLRFHEQEYPIAVTQTQLNGATRYHIDLGSQQFSAQGEISGTTLLANVDGYQLKASVAEHNDGDQINYSLYTQDSALSFGLVEPDLGDLEGDLGGGGLTAPMNGTMVTLLVDTGESVKKDDALLVMEAMKMEHTIRAPADGQVTEFYFQPGDLVDGGAELLAFEAVSPVNN